MRCKKKRRLAFNNKNSDQHGKYCDLNANAVKISHDFRVKIAN